MTAQIKFLVADEVDGHDYATWRYAIQEIPDPEHAFVERSIETATITTPAGDIVVRHEVRGPLVGSGPTLSLTVQIPAYQVLEFGGRTVPARTETPPMKLLATVLDSALIKCGCARVTADDPVKRVRQPRRPSVVAQADPLKAQTYRLPSSVVGAARARATKEGRTMSAVVADLLREYGQGEAPSR